MKIVLASAVPLNLSPERGVSMLRDIEFMARLSHRSEDKMTEDSYRTFMQKVVVDRGDWSVTEHASVSVLFTLDRATAQQLMRHRIAAYTAESMRFVNYTKQQELEFIYPIVGDRLQKFPARIYSEGKYEANPYDIWVYSCEEATEAYKDLLKAGWRPEEARSVLPMATASKVGVTMNLRAWRHVFLMRTSMEAQSMIRSVTEDLLNRFKENIPVLFDDIEPGARQTTNIALGR